LGPLFIKLVDFPKVIHAQFWKDVFFTIEGYKRDFEVLIANEFKSFTNLFDSLRSLYHIFPSICRTVLYGLKRELRNCLA
jgi:hypothetical protein